ncbi:hypothetical protein BGZ80_008641 [Entomortierella chlamydospora]|uniref:Uncharacterized protein n=1 Tax=Entomortierella chlamydospora TaxID=101097 RepID=A0A9P6MX33_9FUNG|nr:hypothetical protein BGZ80_008641 [Entomortierella chlamydospora]
MAMNNQVCPPGSLHSSLSTAQPLIPSLIIMARRNNPVLPQGDLEDFHEEEEFVNAIRYITIPSSPVTNPPETNTTNTLNDSQQHKEDDSQLPQKPSQQHNEDDHQLPHKPSQQPS